MKVHRERLCSVFEKVLKAVELRICESGEPYFIRALELVRPQFQVGVCSNLSLSPSPHLLNKGFY